MRPGQKRLTIWFSAPDVEWIEAQARKEDMNVTTYLRMLVRRERDRGDLDLARREVSAQVRAEIEQILKERGIA